MWLVFLSRLGALCWMGLKGNQQETVFCVCVCFLLDGKPTAHLLFFVGGGGSGPLSKEMAHSRMGMCKIRGPENEWFPLVSLQTPT